VGTVRVFSACAARAPKSKIKDMHITKQAIIFLAFRLPEAADSITIDRTSFELW